MRNVSTTVVLISILALGGCAKDPEKIPAAQMEPGAYSNYSCKQLNEAEIQQRQLLEALTAQQKDAQSGDALGVFLLGLPISSMSGSDKETEIAVAKGKLNAIEARKASRGC